MIKTRLIALFLFVFLILDASAQKPKQASSGEIYHSIEKLNVLGSVLYLAAHPDDENTRFISYASNELKARTAYLSLTRGGGGQNMIGTEISDLLGVLRTNELLQARSKDGGEQFFTRAVDFGYSKHPDETLKVWEKDKVLADVVWVIRNFKPDIIVNRFHKRRIGRTHGHHTSSALLSEESFDLTNDKNVFPEQLKYTEPWQTKRIFYNTSWWAFGGRAEFAKADKSNLMAFDVGVYYPLLGKSNTEIAAEARSMHKCQGFGSAGSRGSTMEYLELIKGDLPKDKSNIFDGINTSWSRVKGGKPIGEKIDMILKTYDFTNPEQSISSLIQVKKMINKLPDGHWKSVKSQELDNIILNILGLYVVANADDQSASQGSEVDLSMEFTNRSSQSIKLKQIKVEPSIFDSTFNQVLEANEENKYFTKIQLPKDLNYSSAYWLTKDKDKGCYIVDEQTNIGKPLTQRELAAYFEFEIDGTPVTIKRDVTYSFTDRVEGEVFRPFEIVPEVFINIKEELYLFGDREPQEISVIVKAGRPDLKGKLNLDIDKTWKVQPESYDFKIDQKGDSKTYRFTLTPPSGQSIVDFKGVANVDGKIYTDALSVIDYDHIPLQTILQPSVSKAVRVNLEKQSERIAYIDGAGDKMPESLRQVGYIVDPIEVSAITLENLNKYDAVVVGIRALNVKEELKFKTETLNQYVADGGTLVYQYNTTRGLKVKEFSPYPLKLSRDRVTVEESEVKILAPKHQVLNYPNKITLEDFDNWVQERGLYFPNEWDPAFTPILEMGDPGADKTQGSLLIAQHGKGHFVYSGISWFRELPNGVPGAFRLFANILDLKYGI